VRNTQVGHRPQQLRAPVVEVTGHDQRVGLRHLARDEGAQALHLAFAAGVDQPQVHHHHVHQPAIDQHLAVQQAALLKAVVRHIGVPMAQHRPATQQRVAVLAVARHRVGTVHRFVARRRQHLNLLAGLLAGALVLAPWAAAAALRISVD